MERPEHPEPMPAWGICLFWLVLGGCTIFPWVAHFTVGWWAGLAVWFGLVALYDRLFVPKGSVCMGIPFVAPLVSLLLLLAYDALMLLRWLLHFVPWQ